MYKSLTLFFLLFFFCFEIAAQVFPREGSTVNYRIIGFSVPQRQPGCKYKLSIAEGNYTDADSFKIHKTIQVVSDRNRVIVEVPNFGKEYTWRMTYTGMDSSKAKGPLHHFTTLTLPAIDTNLIRLRVTKYAEKYKDAYIFLDGVGVLYDMNGKPLWFLPGTDLPGNQAVNARNIKITKAGTITFLTGFQPYEIDFNANIVWQYKKSDNSPSSDIFHHEFTRLENGHYMGMMAKTKLVDVPLYKDQIAISKADSAKCFKSLNYSVLAEFDASGNVVWQWSDLNYVSSQIFRDDVYIRQSDDRNKLYDGRKVDIDLHENSFYFDEKKKNIYMSFRNLDRVIKIKYPDGSILNEYGAVAKKGDLIIDKLFCDQHSCAISQKGHVYLYNNNICRKPYIPTVVIMEEPVAGKKPMTKLWEYQCTIEDKNLVVSEDQSFMSAGGVMELSDQSMFVAMGKPYTKLFIVSHDKNIFWSAMPEKYNSDNKKWEPYNLYRASFVSRKELEELIWKSLESKSTIAN